MVHYIYIVWEQARVQVKPLFDLSSRKLSLKQMMGKVIQGNLSSSTTESTFRRRAAALKGLFVRYKILYILRVHV